jgi:integrase
MSEIEFTKTNLQALPPAAPGTRATYHDEKRPGLMLRVTPAGAKTFYLHRRIDGKPERIALGVFPTMTVEQARKAFDKLNGAIAGGANPAQAKRTLKAEPTFGELLSDFLTKKRNRAGNPLAESTIVGYRGLLNKQLKPLANLKMSKVTPDALRKIKFESDAQNNRARALISSVFTWATHEGLTEAPNPAKAIKNRFIKSRERFLLPDEIPRFFDAVERSSQRDFFLLCLMTGARKANVATMRWQDLNLREGVWLIPKTKNGSSQRVPLVPEALQILESRKTQAVVNVTWVFPGKRSRVTNEVGPMIDPRKAWGALCQDAGFDEPLRIHDLRRTMGSWQARQGTSAAIIGKSLGHKSLQATAIYSRLDLDPVRSSMGGAVSEIMKHRRKADGK